MKKLLLFFFLTAATLGARSQTYNYNAFGIGGGVSAVYPYVDLKQGKNTFVFNVTGYYNISPYLPIGLEFQTGSISGGSIKDDPNNREFTNSYKAIILHGDLYLGQIIDYDFSDFKHIIKDFYIGSGVGVINNDMTYIVRTRPGTDYVFPGQNKSTSLMVPIRFGYEFKLYNSYGDNFVAINLGYIHNFTWGEGLDGYDDPSSKFKNNSPDQYRQFVLGVKFNFGPVSSFHKTLN